MSKRRAAKYKDGERLEERQRLAKQFGVSVDEIPEDMPIGAVLADVSQQRPRWSPGGGPLWYVDRGFTCCDCGRKQIWTAAQQKWWYEVAKGSPDSKAIRCRPCRQARRAGNS